MRLLAVIVTALALVGAGLVAQPSVAATPDRPGPRPGITSGGLADRGEHPYVGAMLAGRYADDIMCSGTMISSRVFLTAAHCTNGLLENGLSKAYVTLGESYLPGRSKVHPGTLVQMGGYPNADYPDSDTDPFDLAVIVLDRPVKLRKYGRLPSAGELDAMDAAGMLVPQRFEPVGYGTFEGPAFDGLGTRRKTSSWAFGMDDHRLGLWQRLDQEESGVCGGDSGGPIFLGDSNVIAATVVSGDENCVLGSLHYRLDTPGAREFLANFVRLP